MVFESHGKPLVLKDVPIPEPNDNQVLIKIHACGVCRTDLHIVDGELTKTKLPLIIGHEIVGPQSVQPGPAVSQRKRRSGP